MKEEYWKAHSDLCQDHKHDMEGLDLIATMDQYVESLENKLKRLNEHLDEKDKALTHELRNLEWHGVYGPPLCLVSTQLKNIAKIREIINAAS